LFNDTRFTVGQVLIAVEVNGAYTARGFAQINRNVGVARLEQRLIRWRFRASFTGNEEHVITEQSCELHQRGVSHFLFLAIHATLTKCASGAIAWLLWCSP
jgi:hypothetical protein